MPLISYYIQTFGCKSNQYESQAIREALDAAGHVETARPEDADLLIVNTCGVTGRAGASCRNAIRKTLRANPALRVVVTGCGVDLGESFPQPETPPLLVPNAKKHAIADMVSKWDSAARTLDDAPRDRFALRISAFRGHTRAFLKIHDGCDNFCAYCAVPRARGVPESRPPDAIMDEAKRLLDSGHRELVLTGINIGAYDYRGVRLADVAEALASLPGLARLRLGSVEPPYMTERLADVMASNAAVCPHVHLPLQSGHDGTLAAMGRRYSTGEFLDKLALLRDRLTLPAVTTDVIVGFPGEDDDSAAATLALCRDAGFSRLHVFLFSPRPGTPAAAMRQRCTDRDIEGRKNRLIAAGEDLAQRFADACVGLPERVVVERSGNGLSDRYVKTRLDGVHAAPGDVVSVRIAAAGDGELLAVSEDAAAANTRPAPSS